MTHWLPIDQRQQVTGSSNLFHVLKLPITLKMELDPQAVKYVMSIYGN